MAKALAAVVISAGLALPTSAHDGDMQIGVDLFTNELKFGFDFTFSRYADFLMEGHPGWWNNEFKFEEDRVGDPRESRDPIADGTEIVLVFENWHPALALYPDGDLDHEINDHGEEYFVGVGGTGFDPRAWWYVDSSHPEYDPEIQFYSVDIRMYDRTGTHLPSATHTLLIEPNIERCVADMTGSGNPNDPSYGVPNGLLDADDFFYFLDRFAAGDDEADLTGSSDPNDPFYGRPDGEIDADDFFYFLDVFSGGCRVY